jgi:hypothetical protein
MSSALSVIALITRLRDTAHTTFGDAIYREKVSNDNPVFSFKQFVNSRHEYNKQFKEGDLVYLGANSPLTIKNLWYAISYLLIL